MKNSKFKIQNFITRFKITLFFIIFISSVQIYAQKTNEKEKSAINQLITGAENTKEYLDLLKNKRIGVVTNHTGIIIKKHLTAFSQPIDNKADTIHLVDYLLQNKISVKRIFVPEHGFRGKADAGEKINDDIDTKTGLPIISLYGKNKKPNAEQLKDIDILLFDLQDVGVRFYTYISTLHYIMEAGAELKIPVIVLDRPNPNGHYIDGPILETSYKSFVGMHPVPVVYGMTIGEYAQMINGEKWLKNSVKCNLTIIKLINYNKKEKYILPVKPSPNLPNSKAINLYPSLCFFEGTNISMGRGTNKQFQIYGSPYLNKTTFHFVPKPNEGDKKPKYNGKTCYGEDLSKVDYLSAINLSWLIKAYEQSSQVKTPFFNNMFNKLAGNNTLQQQIINKKSEKEIRASWQKNLDSFKKIREKYLLYK